MPEKCPYCHEGELLYDWTAEGKLRLHCLNARCGVVLDAAYQVVRPPHRAEKERIGHAQR